MLKILQNHHEPSSELCLSLVHTKSKNDLSGTLDYTEDVFIIKKHPKIIVRQMVLDDSLHVFLTLFSNVKGSDQTSS
jgi:hypothetical protein